MSVCDDFTPCWLVIQLLCTSIPYVILVCFSCSKVKIALMERKVAAEMMFGIVTITFDFLHLQCLSRISYTRTKTVYTFYSMLLLVARKHHAKYI